MNQSPTQKIFSDLAKLRWKKVGKKKRKEMSVKMLEARKLKLGY